MNAIKIGADNNSILYVDTNFKTWVFIKYGNGTFSNLQEGRPLHEYCVKGLGSLTGEALRDDIYIGLNGYMRFVRKETNVLYNELLLDVHEGLPYVDPFSDED